jgi:hypothetical protein
MGLPMRPLIKRPNGGRGSFTQSSMASKRLQELAAQANGGTGGVGGDKITGGNSITATGSGTNGLMPNIRITST